MTQSESPLETCGSLTMIDLVPTSPPSPGGSWREGGRRFTLTLPSPVKGEGDEAGKVGTGLQPCPQRRAPTVTLCSTGPPLDPSC